MSRDAEKAWPVAQEEELHSWVDTDIKEKDIIENYLIKAAKLSHITNRIKEDNRLLDVGAGPISFLSVVGTGREKVAVDTLSDAYKKKFNRDDSVVYVNSESEALNMEDNYFDVVFCLNALDHFKDYYKSIAEMIRVLKMGGILYLEYENTTPLMRKMCAMGYEKPLSIFHPHLLDNDEIIAFCKKNNLRVMKETYKPAFGLQKVLYLVELIMGKTKRGVYDKMVSSTSSGYCTFIFHNILTVFERIFFFFLPATYATFCSITFQKSRF
jgi:ubiquinone/menaquinone biosynthesis C-methylase UbiE